MTATPRPIDLHELPDLDPGDAQRVSDLLSRTQARQSKALDEAIDGGMQHIPRLLRGAVKGVLFR